jgi:ATP-dependent RNA helicase RhlE
MTFKEMKLSEPVLQALQEMQYETPTPIQTQAIPEAMTGRDLLGLAQTGTGKTAAFALPIIEQLLADKNYGHKGTPREIKALVLTPTRELAIQINESFTDYAKFTKIRHTVIFGGVKQGAQTNALKGGVDILTATPGRLLDLMQQGYIKLNNVRHFVLDEADNMLDMGFIHDVKRILPKLPSKKQTLLFSATMPDSINKLAKNMLNNPVRVEVTPAASVVETISQKVFAVEKAQKKVFLAHLLKEEDQQDNKVLVFSRTKHGADNIARYLSKRNIKCESIHGDKSQNARQRALKNFKEGVSNVIVATDIAARGIDIKGLDLVVNYDLPDVPETYVHRIGRTGRAGYEGRATTFCATEEKDLLHDIEKLTGLHFTLQTPDIELPEVTVVAKPAQQKSPQQSRRKPQATRKKDKPAASQQPRKNFRSRY